MSDEEGFDVLEWARKAVELNKSVPYGDIETARAIYDGIEAAIRKARQEGVDWALGQGKPSNLSLKEFLEHDE